jgi:hypothetical protein
VAEGESLAGGIDEVGVVATSAGEASTDGLGVVAAEAHPTRRVDPNNRPVIDRAAVGILPELRREPMLGSMTTQRGGVIMVPPSVAPRTPRIQQITILKAHVAIDHREAGMSKRTLQHEAVYAGC